MPNQVAGPEPVVIIPAAKYAEMEAALRGEGAEWWKPLDNGEAAAAEFMAHFDLERADEWGHVAYCIQRATDVMRMYRTKPKPEPGDNITNQGRYPG